MPKAVDVRIAVAVDANGKWCAYGALDLPDEDAMGTVLDGGEGGEARYWVTATLPVPEPQVAAGVVEAG